MSNKEKIKNLDVTKDELFEDDINRDRLLSIGSKMIKKEMDDCTHSLYNAFNFETKTHKDPHNEAQVYLSKQDVYALFKEITANLILNKPNDPINSMITHLKTIQSSWPKREAENN